jgi:hypothetical protein
MLFSSLVYEYSENSSSDNHINRGSYTQSADHTLRPNQLFIVETFSGV